MFKERMPLTATWTFTQVKQVDGLPFGVVSLDIEAEDRSVRNVCIELEIPLRNPGAQSLADIEAHCLAMAKESINLTPLLRAVRLPE